MLNRYPKHAAKIENVLQLATLVTMLAFVGFYSVLRKRAALPDVDDHLNVMMDAIKISGLAFLLAASTTFLRRYMTDPPLALIWAGLLAITAVAWILSGFIFLSAM